MGMEREREKEKKREGEKARKRIKREKIGNGTMTKVIERDGQINQVNKDRQKEQ